MSSTPERLHAVLLLLVLCLMWGTNWPLFPMALAELSIWTFRVVSVGLAIPVLFGFARWRRLSLDLPRRNWPWLVAASLTNLVIWNLCSALAATYMHSGQAAVLAYTMPLWVALLSVVFLRERLSLPLAVALGFGAAAVLLLLWPHFEHGNPAPLGGILGLAAGLSWAIGTLLVKRVAWGAPGIVVTAWQVAISWIPMLIGAALFGDWQFFVPSWQSIIVVVYIGLVPMAIGTAIWFVIVSLLPTNVAALSSISVPIVAMISGALINAEPFGVLQIAALLFAIAAIWLVLQSQPGVPTPARRRDS